MGELLQNLPPHTVEFLLRTSVVNLLHPELAEVLSGSDSAAGDLLTLERQNAFVSSPATPVGRYRYHPLVTGRLRSQLRAERPRLYVDLQRKAAMSFEQVGQPLDALSLAVEAEDWPLVGRICVRSAGWPSPSWSS